MPLLDDPFFRILCVDDNPTILQAMKMGFGAYGFEVITASHGLEALVQFQANAGNFALILTDNSMPKMNGLELVKAVRTLDFKGRIFIMSENLSISDCRVYRDYKVNGFLSKPFEISVVATMLLQDG
jgi:CheY-like chemotaxis protein